MKRLIPVAVVLAAAMAACEGTVFDESPEVVRLSPSLQDVDYNVVVLVIDGPRYSEAFGDTSHNYVERMWSQLRPQGTLCTNFRNLGTTKTVSGHGAILTGVRQTLNNEGLERPDNPTIFEYYRKATSAPQSDAVLVGGKGKLTACTYSDHVDYGAAYGATEDIGPVYDVQTFDRMVNHLQTNRPRLMVASFSRVDQLGHGGVWDDYVDQISVADSLVTLVWNTLQADSAYAGRTYMFVTADHGRHDDAHGGFQNHGDACDGCRHLVFLALGPDVRAGHEVFTLYTQIDLAVTVGSILGVDMPHADGVVISELFEPVTTGILE